MRILVTGGTGFIGAHVVRRLAACPGVQTSVLIRTHSNLWRLHALGVPLDGSHLRLCRADLCQPCELVAALRQAQPDVIIHLAMVYHPPGSPGGKDADAVNLHGTLSLLDQFLNQGGQRFVAAGSCFEYGDHHEALLTEDMECRPLYGYAIAKAQATREILARAEQGGIDALVLRVFSPFGPLEGTWRVVPQLLAAGSTSEKLPLTPGEQVRDYVYVEDVAAAFVSAALQPRLRRPRAIYNVSSAVGHSLRELAGAVTQALGRPLSLQWGKLPYRDNEVMCLIGDNQRIWEDLHWRPSHSLRDGLRQTLQLTRAFAARAG